MPIGLGCRLEGDGDIEIVRIASLKQAQPGDLSFVANARYLRQMAATQGVGGHSRHHDRDASALPCAVLRADDPYLGVRARRVALRADGAARDGRGSPERRSPAMPRSAPTCPIGPFVTVGAGASIGARTIVYPHAVIGPGARIGDDCVIHAHVSIRERVVVGNRVDRFRTARCSAATATGSPGRRTASHLKIPQHADVVIEDDVEIGANSTVDRPAIGETRIRAGTKIDNLVHVAHGVTVGRRVLLAAQVGIAGSTVIDDDVMVAGQSGITGHIEVGRGVKVGAKSAVLQSVDAGGVRHRIPAFEHAEWRKASIVFRSLPSMKKRIEELEQKIAELEEKLAACQIPDR